mgnify:CR=1 FL=1
MLDTGNTELVYLIIDLQFSLLRIAEEVRIIDDAKGSPHEQPSDHYLGLCLHPPMVRAALLSVFFVFAVRSLFIYPNGNHTVHMCTEIKMHSCKKGHRDTAGMTFLLF